MADYVIRSGDTLGAIAARMGTTVQALAQLNGIANPDRIQAGATIRVPDAPGGAAPRPAAAPAPAASSSGSYTVRSGDTLSRIASQNNTSVEELARLNGISNPNRIGVGQVIQLPAAQGGAPLPPQNPVRPGVPSPPMDRAAVSGDGMVDRQFTQPTGRTSPADAYLAQSRGVETALARQQAGEPQRIAEQDARWQQRDAMPAPLPDFVNMPQRELERYMTDWVSSGRRLTELPPEFQMVWQFRMDEMRAGVERDQRTRQTEQQAYRDQWGTDPRIREPAPPVERSIREGEYLPQEMVQLGQLGSNMRNAPSAALGSLASGTPPPGAPVIDGQYIPPQNATTLGQLAKRPWPFSTAPYYGV